MEKYKVKSGTMNTEVKALNHDMAMMKAIEKESPKALGTLISALKKGDKKDRQVFMITEMVLERMGINIEK